MACRTQAEVSLKKPFSPIEVCVILSRQWWWGNPISSLNIRRENETVSHHEMSLVRLPGHCRGLHPACGTCRND